MASSFGYPKRPADTALTLNNRSDLLDHLQQLPEPHHWDEWLAAEAPLFANYRESLAPLIADPYGEVTSSDNPPPTKTGMAHVIVDGAGRLRYFQANPYQDAEALAPPVAPEAVFRAAGLDFAAFTEEPATFVPAGASTETHTWKGPHPRIPGLNLTVDLASWKGRITEANVRFDWPKNSAAPASLAGTFVSRLRWILLMALSVMGLLGVLLLARRNWRLGHVDRKGALRIGLARCLLGFLAWIGAVHPVANESMIPFFFANCAVWLMWGAVLAVLYIALEPLVRARWPHSIVTWSRLLVGRWLDAQVSSHILIGAAVGAAVWVAAQGFGDWQNPGMDGLSGINATLGTRHWLAEHTLAMQGALFFGLLVFFAICGLRLMVKVDWASAILAALLLVLSSGNVFSSPNWKLQAAISIGIYSVLILVLLRLGLVATMAAVFFIDSFNLITLGTDWKTWYAPAGLASFALLLGIAVFAFWRSFGSHELFAPPANP
jgi:serine/threonine-protein kinase